MKFFGLAVFSMALAGCGSNTVSPEISTKQGITTGIGDHGYPIITSIKLTRPQIDRKRLDLCLSRNVDQPEGPLSSDERTSQISGRVAYLVPQGGIPATWRIRYTLEAAASPSTTVFEFTRIAYLNDSGMVGNTLMASSYWAPERAYTALEKVVDAVMACAL